MSTDTQRGVLAGMRVIEASAFVAAPLGGVVLAGLGADVIRIDPIGGAIDQSRWPVTANGFSFYWAGLNQGKRSVVIDTSTDEGRDLALSIASAPGKEGGLALTNHPAGSWFCYKNLRESRADMIVCSIEGHADGRPAVDYSINAATGLPMVTGPDGLSGPVNSVLPAWDVVTGNLAVIGLLAAERARYQSSRGALVSVALEDVAYAVVAHLGFVGDSVINGESRPRIGNDLYGAFGRDFETADGKRLMVVAITAHQLHRLFEAVDLDKKLRILESTRDTPIAGHGDLFELRGELGALLSTRIGQLDFEELQERFDAHRVIWGPYQDFAELATGTGRWSINRNDRFAVIDHPGVGAFPIPRSPLRFSGRTERDPQRAPNPGEHTAEVLEDVLGLSSCEIGGLHDRKVVASWS
ncbi:MAG: CoA transferase [Actinomycetota bacterium]|nr:CoA transferase [Actinomycetota bacterium]